MKNTITLFGTGFLQVYFVSVNTYFISREMYVGVVIAAFLISMVWTFNVKRAAFGSNRDRIVYSFGATLGSLAGVWSSSILMGLFVQ